MRQILFLIGFLLIAISCWGTDYYVSPSGADNATGTEVNPWKTLSYGAAQMTPGDTLIALDGNYTDAHEGGTARILQIAVSGNSTDWITFKAQNYRQAIIDGQNDVNSTINIAPGVSYIIIEDFKITRGKKFGIEIYGNNITISNNYICDTANENNSTSAVGHCGIFTSSQAGAITISDSEIYHNGRVYLSKGDALSGNDHGIYCCSTTSTIQSNDIYENESHGIKIAGYTTITNINIINNKIYDQQNWGGIRTQLSGITNLTIERNLIYNNNDDGVKMGADHGGHIVSYNIIYGNNGTGILSDSNGTTIYNNTIYNNAERGLTLYGAASKDNIIKNNILSQNTSYELWCVEGAEVNSQEFNYNDYHDSGNVIRWGWGTYYTLVEFQAATSYGDNSIQDDPLFTDTANDNFTLASGSPCINTGTGSGEMLDPDSVWPSGVLTTHQNILEIGAYGWVISSTFCGVTPVGCTFP